jgi:hypothetical protein
MSRYIRGIVAIVSAAVWGDGAAADVIFGKVCGTPASIGSPSPLGGSWQLFGVALTDVHEYGEHYPAWNLPVLRSDTNAVGLVATISAAYVEHRPVTIWYRLKDGKKEQRKLSIACALIQGNGECPKVVNHECGGDS